MLKNNKGITLIALVITIIVLLILAGVSIAMLTGSSGVLTKANEADINNARGEARDRINSALNGVYAELMAMTDDPSTNKNMMNSADIKAINGLEDEGATKIGTYDVQVDFTKTTENASVVTIKWTPKSPTNSKYGSPILGEIKYVPNGINAESTGSSTIKYKIAPAQDVAE